LVTFVTNHCTTQITNENSAAQVLVGGKIVHPGGAKGDFFQPTVLTGVTPAMRIWREEVFGPVMVVVPFADDAQAVALANDCAFGLGSNVFSRNLERANAIATQLQVLFCPMSLGVEKGRGGVLGFVRVANLSGGVQLYCIPQKHLYINLCPLA